MGLIKPQLAKAGTLPTGSGWIYEVKWDGYRGIAVVKDGVPTLQSRSGKSDLTATFPEVIKALSGLPDGTILDGELVVLDGVGNSDFGRMDQKGQASYVVFDCLEAFGINVRGQSLTERKALADAFVQVLGSPRVVTSVCTEDGASLLKWADEQGIEGIVAKRAKSSYRDGSRNGDWLKIKLRQEQEFAVIGWIPGEGSRDGIAGSLLLAVHDGDSLAYCGRVGTGGDLDQWRGFSDHPRLPEHLGPNDIPVKWNGAPRAELRDAVLVEPFVAQVRFQRWTEDNHLWHPSVVGVRTDKEPHECRREA